MTNTTAAKRQFVLDSNILINDPHAPFQFDEHDIVITMTVLQELDKIKDSKHPRHAMSSKDASLAIQVIKGIINGANSEEISNGVSIGDKAGMLRVFNDYDLESSTNLPKEVPDNRIISAAVVLQDKEIKKKSGVETVLVTGDINCKLVAKTAGCKHVEDYDNEKQLDDIAYLASGYLELNDPEFFDRMSALRCNRKGTYNAYTMPVDDLPEGLLEQLYLNLYVYHTDTDTVYQIKEIEDDVIVAYGLPRAMLMGKDVFGIKARSLLQGLALHALMDDEIDIVQLTGPAGSGKTLLALAAGLEQSPAGNTRRYSKVLVTRSTPEMAEAIGFLPGTEEEKMAPWLAAFSDSMEVLCKADDVKGHTADKFQQEEADKHTMELLVNKANMQYKSLTFMRGRSLIDTYCILDESQNLTPHQMRSAITRIGNGSKLVVLGNLGQIDAKYVTPLTSGLTHAVERMKSYDGGATIALPGGERSRLSAFAEENL